MDSTDDIKRNELLKLGGIGALAVIAALVAETAPVQANTSKSTPKPKPKPTSDFNNNPIGLDVTLLAAIGNKRAKIAATTQTATKVIMTGDVKQTAGAKIVYTIATPTLKGHLPNGNDHDDPDLQGTAYVAIWY